MEMKPIPENSIAEAVGIIPSVLLRPILTPPRHSGPADPPLYVYACPHSGMVRLITEPITLLPTVVEAIGPCPYCTAEQLAAQRPREPFDRPTTSKPKPKGDPTPCPHARATVLLRFGDPLFVGSQLVRGYPDRLPIALTTVLNRRFQADLGSGRRQDWLLCPPQQLTDRVEAA